MTRDKCVLDANQAFYRAFRCGDYDAMRELWSARPDIAVYHPNWPGLFGRDDVMESWYQVLVLSDPPSIAATDETVLRNGRTATVFCTESFDFTRIFATNVFVLEADDTWRMVHHQATHLPEAEK